MAEIKQIQAGGINYDVSDVRLDYKMITNWNELFPIDSTRRRIYAYSNGGSGVSNTPYNANDSELFYGYSEGNNYNSIQVVKTVWSSADANNIGRMFVRSLFNGNFSPWVEISGKVSGPSSATNNAVAIFDGTGGKTIKNSGFTIGKSVPSDAKFTDTTYSQIARGSNAGLAPGLPSGSGTTKYLREDGSWQVPPDTNTWRPVQDNLTSTSTTDCLSANQGKVLNDNIGNSKIINKKYYSAATTLATIKSDIDSAIAPYAESGIPRFMQFGYMSTTAAQSIGLKSAAYINVYFTGPQLVLVEFVSLGNLNEINFMKKVTTWNTTFEPSIDSKINNFGTVDVSAGKKATMYYGCRPRGTVGTEYTYEVVPFGFTTKNVDYTVSGLSAITLANVGSVTPTVQMKGSDFLILKYPTQNTDAIASNVTGSTFTITFA